MLLRPDAGLILDRVLDTRTVRRLLGWAAVAHGFLLTAMFLLTPGFALNDWFPGASRAFDMGADVSLPMGTPVAVGLVALTGVLVGGSLRRTGAGVSELLVFLALVLPAWLLVAARLTGGGALGAGWVGGFPAWLAVATVAAFAVVRPRR